jgi:hypothetical protein
MNWHNIRRIVGSDSLLLLPIMALAFYLAFIPHHDYPYSMHLDEWTHLAAEKEIVKEASVVDLTDPFTGGSSIGNQQLEVGFHLLWAVFYQISGISWLTIVRYFPGIVFMITVLSVYVLARRQGFGWEAAFFTTLIPTTVGILGPGFMVPVAMGLLFIALSLVVAFSFRTWRSYLVLSVFVVFLFFLHSATAVGLITILVPYILLNVRGNFKHSLGIALALALPFLVALPLLFSVLVLPTARALLSPQLLPTFVDIPRIIETYGYLPVLLAVLGTFLLAVKGGVKNYGLLLGLLILLALLATMYSLHYGIAMMYFRGLQYMMLMLGIVAGAGLVWVRRIKLPARLSTWLRTPLLNRHIGNILCVTAVGLTLAIAIPARQSIPYYRMIDSEDYAAFLWIKDNVSSEYDRAILDPWKGTAFTAITGKYIYVRIGEYPTDEALKAYNFLDSGAKDTDFLRQQGISIVYSRSPVDNPDLIKVRENVYLLRPARDH